MDRGGRRIRFIEGKEVKIETPTNAYANDAPMEAQWVRIVGVNLRSAEPLLVLNGAERNEAMRNQRGRIVLGVLTVLLLLIGSGDAFAQIDPGPRGGPADAGGPIPGLKPNELSFFQLGLEVFGELAGVANGLGPRFNLDSCAGCHAQPAVGGTSPFINPQVEVATKNQARNEIPFFITLNGPVREARFKFKPDGTRDGGVHALFTITGRADAAGCDIVQPDFLAEARHDNLVFRIPTPVFGAGLIENIPNNVILENKNSQLALKKILGISGRENRSGNDGTIARFGWKAQVKSPFIFSGEAYNVEQGVTNELFPQERDETQGCVLNLLPEDRTNFDGTTPAEFLPDLELFSFFMRFLAPPTPAQDTPATIRGRKLFNQIGCSLCHTPRLATGKTGVEALSNQEVNLFSDLLLHNMGRELADDIFQGNAGPDEFRTAPLWGLGQRIFFLHDGRTADLHEAIKAHKSPGSEANRVILAFNTLTGRQKQDILDFLRSL
ncbi:MAG TPA: di-heme oxidoredictase family protein [Thermodesulfobacteriota bacterium]|nr:di-heme oxidoredictase family protein [Thermodesulfobacteriota bacterium]